MLPDRQRLLSNVHADLEQHADPEYRARAAQYMRKDVDQYLGVPISVVRKIARGYFKEIRDHGIDDILELCEVFLETGISEHRTVAFDWSFRCKRDYEPRHFPIFERWLKTYVDDWGSCDDFCTHTLGEFVLQYPECFAKVRTWADSDNRWLRRASAVALIYSVRTGKHLDRVFEMADLLLTDEDDMVQKGYGWMLKTASKSYPDEVFEYVMKNKDVMPRTSLRYAIEKMPPELRQQAMEK